jgi:tetratricopeptide (TPR) repeat protein
MPEAERHFSRALDLLRTLPPAEDRSEAELALLTQLGPVLIHTKGWARPEVHDVYSRALEIARGLDQPLALVPPLAGLWVTYNFTARYDAAREVVDEMFRAAERSSDDSVLVQAHHTALGTMWVWRSQRSSMLLPHRLCILAEGRLAAGRREEALAIIDEALGQVERTNEQFLASKARLVQSEALLLGGQDERERGQHALGEALELARKQSARSMELRISTRFARLWTEQGDRQRAHDFLAPISGSFASHLDGTDLKEARQLLQVLQ